jgi:hypothetical protein
VWLDPLFDKQVPRIQVVSAGQVARQRLLGWWCNLVGHRTIEVRVLEGSPVGEGLPGDETDKLMTIPVALTDGRLQEFVLEPATRIGCRVCKRVDRHQVDRGAGMARLRPTDEQESPVASPVPQQFAGPLWLRMWLPWNPWGPFRGFYISIVAPTGIFATSLLVTLHQLGWIPRVTGWPALIPAIAIVVDIVLSNVCGYLREFLKTCGARFDRAEPFGQRPGTAELWKAARSVSTSGRLRNTLRLPTEPNPAESCSIPHPEPEEH